MKSTVRFLVAFTSVCTEQAVFSAGVANPGPRDAVFCLSEAESVGIVRKQAGRWLPWDCVFSTWKGCYERGIGEQEQ